MAIAPSMPKGPEAPSSARGRVKSNALRLSPNRCPQTPWAKASAAGGTTATGRWFAFGRAESPLARFTVQGLAQDWEAPFSQRVPSQWDCKVCVPGDDACQLAVAISNAQPAATRPVPSRRAGSLTSDERFCRSAHAFACIQGRLPSCWSACACAAVAQYACSLSLRRGRDEPGTALIR